MGYRLVPLLLGVFVCVLGACGKEIGDACVVATDCSPNGDRQCDPDGSSPGGYCTIFGCDYSTCPDEAVCVRFFAGHFSKTCDPAKAPDACISDPASCCSLDELCAVGGSSDSTLGGYCVPRSAEVRYCMRTCGSDGDCRDGYECRGIAEMKRNGGEPVLAPGRVIDADGRVINAADGTVIDADAPKFCAAAPASS